MPDPSAAGTKALRQNMSTASHLKYCSPRYYKIREEQTRAVLVAPRWPRRPWHPHMLSMCRAYHVSSPPDQSCCHSTWRGRGTLCHQPHHQTPSVLEAERIRLQDEGIQTEQAGQFTTTRLRHYSRQVHMPQTCTR